jgi:hypothetical protein
VVESKEPIHKLFRNTDLSNISNKNDLSRTDVYKKIGKLKTVQELKNFFKISDPLLKALEQPGKSVKEVFNEYILLRELYGLNDKRVTDIVSK